MFNDDFVHLRVDDFVADVANLVLRGVEASDQLAALVGGESIESGGVEFLVCQVKPGGALVVEVADGSVSRFHLLGITTGVEDG